MIAPIRTESIIVLKPLEFKRSVGEIKFPAALFTSRLTFFPSVAFSISSNSLVTLCSSLTSQLKGIMLPLKEDGRDIIKLESLISLAVVSTINRRREAMQTVAPRRARVSAMDLPSPDPPPVTKAIDPEKVPLGSIGETFGGRRNEDKGRVPTTRARNKKKGREILTNMADEDSEYADDFEDPVTILPVDSKAVSKNLIDQTETVNARLRSGQIRHAYTSPLVEKISMGVNTERIQCAILGVQVPDDLEMTRSDEKVLASSSTVTSATGTAASAFQIAAPRLAAFLKTISPLVSNLLDEIAAEALMSQKEKRTADVRPTTSDLSSRLMPVLSTVALMKDVPLLLQRKVVCVAQSPADHRDFALAFGPMPESAAALLLRKHGVSVLQNIREGSIVTVFSNGKLSSVLSCSSQQVLCLSFADDVGKIVMAGCSDGLVHVWDRSEPSGRHPSSCGSGVLLHDPKDGSPVVQQFVSLPVEGGLRSPSFSAGGISIHQGNDDTLQSFSFLSETCSILSVFPIKRNNSLQPTTIVNEKEKEAPFKHTTNDNTRARLRTGAGLRTLLLNNEEMADMQALSMGQLDNVSSMNSSTSHQIGTIDSRGRLDIWVILRNSESIKMKRVDSLSVFTNEAALGDLSSGPLCCDAAASPSDASEYVIALTSGRLLRLLRTESNSVGRPPLFPRLFESPSPLGVPATRVIFNPVPLSISSNSFSPPVNLLAVGYSDGKICIFSSRHASPIATLHIERVVGEVHGSKIVLLQWLRHRPTVLITLDESGMCAVFDFLVSITGPVFLANMSPQAGLKVQSASCTGCGPYEPISHVSIVAVFTNSVIEGDEERGGRVGEGKAEEVIPRSFAPSEHMTVLKLNEEFCVPRGDEVKLFRTIFNSLR